jgi:hypothetical protein
MKEAQQMMLDQLFRVPFATGFTVVMLLLCWAANVDLPVIGPGPNTWFGALILGYLHLRWLLTRIRPDRSPVEAVYEGAVSVLVLPVSLLGGRAFFTFFPPWHSTAGAVLGLLVGAWAIKWLLNDGSRKFVFSRGANVINYLDAVRRNALAGSTARAPVMAPNSATRPAISWANLDLTRTEVEGGVFVVGAPGSGKTRMMRTAMRSAVAGLRIDTNCRVLVFDLKQDLMSELGSWQPAVPVHVLNPFDVRSQVWEMSIDLTDPMLALDYAQAFLPDQQGSTDRDNRYFRRAAQVLLSAAFETLIRVAPGRWTLRDLIHLTSSKDGLKLLFGSVEEIERAMSARFKPPRTFADALSTLDNEMQLLRPTAALWESCERKFTVRDWLGGGASILVLGTVLDRQQATGAIHRAIFKTIVDQTLAGPESMGEDRLLFFCDELAAAGALSGIHLLTADGRSKGARWFLGAQDYEGMCIAYGSEDSARSIMNRCSNLSVLRLASDKTAEWASKRLGDVERYEYMSGSSVNHKKEVTTSQSESLVTRPSFLPSELLHIPLPENGNLSGVHFIAGRGVFQARTKHDLHRADAQIDSWRRPDIGSVLLKPWSDADARRLGIGPYAGQQPAVPIDWLERFERVSFDS